jgi:hypothetical protein
MIAAAMAPDASERDLADRGPETPPPGPRADLLALLTAGVASAAAVLVVAAYVVRAAALVAYPWDWSPDEGLHLDYARRALEAPATLYPHQIVPFPSAYGPLLPVLMAPLMRLAAPLLAARVLMLLAALLATAAIAWYLRRRAGWVWAAAGVALALGAFDVTFWSMLVRTDGPMLTLWLWGVVVLLPDRLERGADRLSGRRLWTGAGLLLAAVLVKPTAAFHAAPVVLGWFLVDVKSATRLTTVLAVAGLATFASLNIATGGAFLWVNTLWGHHPTQPGLTGLILRAFAGLAWPVLTLAVGGALAALAAGSRPWRESVLLPILGGLTVLPLIGKHGASWNYFIPLHSALVLAGVCWFALAGRSWRPDRSGRLVVRYGSPLLVALVALALAGTRTFPLPTSEDAATARAFYGYTAKIVDEAGGPVLVGCPDLVYFRVGQPVEIEGSSFLHLAEGDAPGAREVLERTRERRYTLVVETWPISEAPEWREALEAGYRHVGGCTLGWYFGEVTSHILLRRDLPYRFVFPPGARCALAAAPRSP